MVIRSQAAVWRRVAVTNRQMQIFVAIGIRLKLHTHWVIKTIAHAGEEPDFTIGALRHDGIKHAEHRCNAYASSR